VWGKRQKSEWLSPNGKIAVPPGFQLNHAVRWIVRGAEGRCDGVPTAAIPAKQAVCWARRGLGRAP
jgi:hypothetical protein